MFFKDRNHKYVRREEIKFREIYGRTEAGQGGPGDFNRGRSRVCKSLCKKNLRFFIRFLTEDCTPKGYSNLRF